MRNVLPSRITARLSTISILNEYPESGLLFWIYLYTILDDVTAVDKSTFAPVVFGSHTFNTSFLFCLTAVGNCVCLLPQTQKPGGRTPGYAS